MPAAANDVASVPAIILIPQVISAIGIADKRSTEGEDGTGTLACLRFPSLCDCRALCWFDEINVEDLADQQEHPDPCQ
jgi:hypothetical protein